MASSLEDLRLDLAELRNLRAQATRPKVMSHLDVETLRIEASVKDLEQKEYLNKAVEDKSADINPVKQTPKCYDVKITNYAWDQSDKFMKLYISLKNVHVIPKENILCSFQSRLLELIVKELDGKNHVLRIVNLLHPIVPDGSHFKVKTDSVVVFLKKSSTAHWAYVTQQDKKIKDVKKPEVEKDSDDPSKSLMDMMKKMYDEGDDDMKRTIAKAWTESRDKASVGDMP